MTFVVEIGWKTSLTSAFVIGLSTLGGTDVIAGSAPNPYLTYTYRDETANCVGVTIRRGKTDDLGQLLAGRCTLTFKDAISAPGPPDIYGLYNPLNPSSPLFDSDDLGVNKPIRVKKTVGITTYTIFKGYTQRIISNSGTGQPRTTIECVDLITFLTQARPVIGSTGATTIGGAIGKVLDATVYNETVGTLRSLATGDSISDFSADGNQTATALIADLLKTERGIFYISGSGVATYEDRNSRYKSPRDVDQATFTDTAESMTGETDTSQIYNDIRVTRSGGSEQQQTDGSSIRIHGRRPLVLTGVNYLGADTDANNLAKFLLQFNKVPKFPTTVVLNNRVTAVYEAFLVRDINDRVTVVDTRGGTNASFYINSIEHNIGGGALTVHRVVWKLDKRPTNSPFIIGVSTLGSTDILSY